MQRLVESLQVNSVADLYVQYARFARSYSLADNPLRELTLRIPQKAQFYTVVRANETAMAESVMKRLAGRRKLQRMKCHKDDIRWTDFAQVEDVVIFYA